ncbi:MAG: FAD-dependent thymidylate synthase [Candidatus Neomarinimicrobiota bacterium]
MSATTTTEPQVVLTKAFATPFKGVVAAARTCYSGKGIIEDEQIDLAPGGRDRAIAQSIYAAGHHTTFQHAQFQFALSGISRHFIWSFLHSHPFYNSEQVSQRYVRLKRESVLMPPLKTVAREHYLAAVDLQMDAYRRLREALFPVAEAEYFRLFPARGKRREDYRQTIMKKAQEVARYVAPVGTLAYLYHTVSGITLLRYWRVCRAVGAPWEQQRVVERMVQAVLDHDPQYEIVLQEPLAPEDFTEFSWVDTPEPSPAFAEEFDASLGGRISKLVDHKANGEQVLAAAVREVLGRPAAELPNDEAIVLALDPARNRLHGETLNLTTHGLLTRTLNHLSYTFRKRLSHTADSQNQRHRMTPASRPALAAQIGDQPDYVTPVLIKQDEAVNRLYGETMERIWDARAGLLRLGPQREFADYLLPNAVAVRFTESADLLNLHHKMRMRLCYNAQEEIWRAAVDEAVQVSEVHPRIGKFLLPPCTQRALAGKRPYCPEGDRYCGVPVWKLDVGDYERLL